MLDQILIRMGVDAKAVSLGLNQVSSLAKGWATSLTHELKGKIGGFLVAGFALEALNETRRKMLEIKDLSEETGLSTNFIQGMMLRQAKMGKSIDDIVMPLQKFNKMIGEAKMGVPSAIKNLYDLGIISQGSAVKTLTLSSAMAKLAEKINNVEDGSRRAAMLAQAFGKGGFKMVDVLEGGTAGVESMESANPFIKMQPETIGIFVNAWGAVKQASYIVAATTSNILGETLHVAYAVQQYFMRSGNLLYGWTYYTNLVKKDIESFTGTKEKSKELTAFESEAEKEGLSVEEAKLKLQQQETDLLEKQLELTSAINDRNKPTIAMMAAHARKMLGLPEPKNYSVSANDRLALRIENLNKKATFAYERGDIAGGQALTSEADSLRKGLGESVSLKERDPMRSATIQLEKVNAQLGPVKEAADLILGEHRKPK